MILASDIVTFVKIYLMHMWVCNKRAKMPFLTQIISIFFSVNNECIQHAVCNKRCTHMCMALVFCRNNNELFCKTICNLEASPKCQNQQLISFLLLPMQRIVRLKMLVEQIVKRLPEDDKHITVYLKTLGALINFVKQCNEEARRMAITEDLVRLQKRLDFDKIKVRKGRSYLGEVTVKDMSLLAAATWNYRRQTPNTQRSDIESCGREQRQVKVLTFKAPSVAPDRSFRLFINYQTKKVTFCFHGLDGKHACYPLNNFSEDRLQVLNYCPRRWVRPRAINERDGKYYFELVLLLSYRDDRDKKYHFEVDHE